MPCCRKFSGIKNFVVFGDSRNLVNFPPTYNYTASFISVKIRFQIVTGSVYTCWLSPFGITKLQDIFVFHGSHE